MPYKGAQELLEAFSENRAIGIDLAAKFNAWNEENIDEDKNFEPITQEMSGDSVVMRYLENGFSEDEVVQIIKETGFETPDESDDILKVPEDSIKEIDERLGAFLTDCIDVSNRYAGFVKEIKLQSGCEQDKNEVRIVLPAEQDFRRMPHQMGSKIEFMHFLKDLRDSERKYSMADETMCFCAKNKEFWIAIAGGTRKVHRRSDLRQD